MMMMSDDAVILFNDSNIKRKDEGHTTCKEEEIGSVREMRWNWMKTGVDFKGISSILHISLHFTLLAPLPFPSNKSTTPTHPHSLSFITTLTSTGNG